MRFCVGHWSRLREAVEARGLLPLVARNGAEAIERIREELSGKASESTYDPLMAYALAEQYRGAGMCAPALPLYEWYFQMEPDAARGHIGQAQCLLLSLRLDEARAAALRAIRNGARVRTARQIIAASVAHSKIAEALCSLWPPIHN